MRAYRSSKSSPLMSPNNSFALCPKLEEVKRIDTTMIGGVVTSAVLGRLLYPALYVFGEVGRHQTASCFTQTAGQKEQLARALRSF